jgi:hypothetical protein
MANIRIRDRACRESKEKKITSRIIFYLNPDAGFKHNLAHNCASQEPTGKEIPCRIILYLNADTGLKQKLVQIKF